MTKKSFLRHLPNTLTSLNLICGCLAIPYAYNGRWTLTLALLLAGAFFDFFDGLAARLLGVSSPIGKELDSLADVVSFGAVPSMMVFHLLWLYTHNPILPFSAFILLAFSALRLAKFNLDTRQNYGFIGLPTPANALFWASAAFSLQNYASTFLYYADVTLTVIFVILIGCGIVFTSWLMVSEVPMFALKFKAKDKVGTRWRIAFISLALLLSIGAFLLGLQTGGIALTVLLYVIISIFLAKKTRSQV